MARWEYSFPEPESFNGSENNRQSYKSERYICADCDAHSSGALWAFDHHRQTGHAVRGRSWPITWANMQFHDSDCNGRCRPFQKKRTA